MSALERNLHRLLRDAYEPARPDEAFRARVLERVAAASRPRSTPAGPRVWLTLAAAALLLAVLLPFAFDGAGGPTTLEDILGAGQVAVRTVPTGEWSAADGLPIAQTTEWLQVAAPAGGPAGLVATGEGDVGVLAGVAVLSRVDDGELAPSVHVLVVGGEAWLGSPDGPRLSAGESAHLRGGRLLDGSGEPAPRIADTEGRRPVEGGAAPGPAEEMPAEEMPVDGGGVDGGTAEGAGGATIAGRVTSGGEPVRAFTAHLVPRPDMGEVSPPTVLEVEDPDGRFRFEGLEAGDWSVYFDVEEHAVHRVGPRAIAAGDVIELDVELERGWTLTGFVRDAETGAPIVGATVLSERDAATAVLLFDGSFPFAPVRDVAVTGADGWFELVPVSSGEHILRATAPGYATAWVGPVTVGHAERPDSVDFDLGPGGAIEGRVTRDGEPCAGLQVAVALVDFTGARDVQTYGTAEVEDDGRYAIEHLPEGFYGVVLLSAGFDDLSVGIRQAAVREGERTAVDFELGEGPRARIVGRLLDPEGEPMGGSTVIAVRLEPSHSVVDSAWRAAGVGEDGRFEIGGLDAGSYHLFAGDALDFLVARHEAVDVGDGESAEVELRLPGGTIAGRVRDGRTGEGVPAVVVLVDTGRELGMVGKEVTDAAGAFSFDYAYGGAYELYAYPLDGVHGADVRRAVALRSDGRLAAQDVSVFEGASVLVRVRDASGAPVARAVVAAAGGLGEQFLTDPFTNTDGELRVLGVRPGPLTVTVKVDGRAGLERTLDVLAGQEHELLFELDH